jgi:Ca-activated chloride channel family protein
VHTLRLTRLPPGAQARVRIVVDQPLEVVDGEWRWRFPTTVAPRYTPGEAIGHGGPGVHPDTDAVPDASRLSPPLRLAGGVRLDLEVELRGAVKGVRVSSHVVSLGIDDGGLRIAPAARATLDRDFVLAFRTGDDAGVSARAWTDGAHTLLVVDPPVVALPSPLPRDAVFVVDISGSMGGTKMAAAKLALKTALHGLLPQDRFLLIAFDDQVEHFHPGFLAVDDAALRRADRWIAALDARGGTEMAPALQAALAPAPVPGRLRTVLFITDGQSTDEDRLLQIVWHKRQGARVFPLGIDTAVNEGLMRRLGRLGGGVAELCDPSDDIEAVVARIEARFGAPLVTGLQVDGAVAATGAGVDVFAGRPATLLLEGGAKGFTVRGTAKDGAWSTRVVPAPAPFALGPAWARARVAELQDRLVVKPFEDDAIHAEVLRVALAHGVASRWTAFVAVDRSARSDRALVEVVQPVELPHSWEGAARRGPPGAPPPRRAMPAGAMAPPPPMAAGLATLSFGMSVARPSAMPAAPSMDRARTGGGGAPSPKRAKAAAASGGLGSRLRQLFPGGPPEAADEAEEVMASLAPGAALDAELDAAPAMPAAEAPLREEAAPARRLRADGAGVAFDEKALAAAQGADGSFGGDLRRTAAALLALLARGHTRRAGLRARVVAKAAGWLAGRTEPLAARVLDALARVEAGGAVDELDWDGLIAELGPEGGQVRAARG